VILLFFDSKDNINKIIVVKSTTWFVPSTGTLVSNSNQSDTLVIKTGRVAVSSDGVIKIY